MTPRPVLSRPVLSRPVVRPAAVALVGLLALTACSTDSPQPATGPLTQQPAGQPTPTPDPQAPASSPSPYRVGAPEVVAEGLEVPWGLDFLPSGSALVTERDTARILRVDADGTVAHLGTVAEAAAAGESGLLGLAVDPTVAGGATPAVFVHVTTEADNRVLRIPLTGPPEAPTGLGEPSVVLDGIPRGFIHDGGRIAFGPDGHLYVATGEVGDPELAQDPGSLGGKILRVTPEGEPAPGNPDPDSPVFSLGHRNVQGLAWDDAGRLWASEFGDQEFDEINLITPGGNYGWPRVEGTPREPGEFADPALVWPVDQASPSGIAHAEGHLWVATLRGNRLWQVSVLPDGTLGRAVAHWEGRFGRLRTVAVAPDGALWVTTSNLDGRGDPEFTSDQILRLTPRPAPGPAP